MPPGYPDLSRVPPNFRRGGGSTTPSTPQAPPVSTPPSGSTRRPRSTTPRTPTTPRGVAVQPTRPTEPPAWQGGAYTGSRPENFQIPAWVTGADDGERWDRYKQYLAQNPTARGNRILHGRTGNSPGNGFARPGGTGGGSGAGTGGQGPSVPLPPSPQPARPSSPSPYGGYPEEGGWGGGGSQGYAGQQPVPYAFNDPFQGVLSMIPTMNANLQNQIGGAMASAGLTGNRYGTFAAERAGELGAENAMAQNAMLNQAYLDYANQRENRALQATGQATGLGGLLDQIQQSQITTPFQVGAWEQGRQDGFGQLGLQQFNQDKLGWLPYLLQAATSQGAGSPGQIYQTQGSAPKPGALDYLGILGSLFS